MNEEVSKFRKYIPTVIMTLWMSMVIIGSQIMFDSTNYFVSSYLLLIGNVLAFLTIAFFAKIE